MALKRLGVNVEHIGFSEIDKYAIQSYLAIHGDVKNYGDITKMTEIPPCDIFPYLFPINNILKFTLFILDNKPKKYCTLNLGCLRWRNITGGISVIFNITSFFIAIMDTIMSISLNPIR